MISNASKFLVFFLLLSTLSLAQISINSTTFTYTQDFNSLTSAGTWTNNSTLTGWYARTDATASVTTFALNTGTTTTAGLYSFAKLSADTTRSIGFVASNSYTGSAGIGKSYIAVRLKNLTGITITSIPIYYRGRQWRKENNAAAHSITVEFQVSSSAITDVTSGSWTSIPALTFTSPITGATTAAAIDGSLSANYVDLSTVVTVNLPNDSEIMFRFSDLNDSGNDHFLAIDDFSFNGGSSALPVELTSFTASSANGTVNLNWATATEVSNYGFDVERSADKSVWNKIGFVAGNGNSNSVKSYSYSDNTASAGTVYYRLKQLDTDGKYEYSKVVSVNTTTPDAFSVDQNFPNPFNPSTTIRFSLANSSNVKVDVYASNGELVHTLANKTYEAGNHAINFDASQLSAGIYLYRITAIDAAGKTFSAVKKMQLIK